MLTAFAIGFVCFFFSKFFVKTKDLQSANSVFVVDDIIFSKNIDKNGTKRFFKEGQLHRIGLPAVEHADGSKEWYVNGKLHREDGPAIEGATGHKAWHLNGEFHRVDGPAIEWVSGSKTWYLNGERHRTDGPAIEWYDGKKEWFVNGERHRTDGPAVEYADGGKEWYVDGEKFTETEFNDYVNSKSTMTVLYGCKIWKNNKREFHRVDGPAVEYSDGKKEWCINDKLHRTDGPAVEYANGTKKWFVDGICHRTDGPAIELANGMRYWYVNGLLHRVDGPAIEGAVGHKEWHLNGLLHREDGPAVEYAGGVNKSWYIEGKELTETEFNDYVNSKSFMVVNEYGAKVWKNKEGKLHRVDGPAVDWLDGHKCWWINGVKHREDGPAVEKSDGSKEWYVNGNLHRIDGPAIEGPDGFKAWCVNGNRLSQKEFNDYVNSNSTMAVDKYGHKFWKNKKGQYHREDGPACEYVHGIKQWFVEGKELTEQQFNNYMNSKSTMTFDTDGKKWTNKEGEYHRTDGPAIELLNGTKFWYLNGKCHREDGPAVECSDGSKLWYLNDKLMTQSEFNDYVNSPKS